MDNFSVFEWIFGDTVTYNLDQEKHYFSSSEYVSC